jgi:hypothetical protein
MRRAAGYVLAVFTAILVVVGTWFVLAAGGNEPEPIIVTGGFMLALGAVIGVGAAVLLRSK